MADPPVIPATSSNLLSTHAALLDTLISFLTVATHHILYLRHIYPPISFLSARAYNYPVRQNRHPAVCRWINDAVAAVRDQLEKNTVERVSLCIYECTNNRALERWTFDLHSLPTIAKSDTDIPFDFAAAASAADDADSTGVGAAGPAADHQLSRAVNVADLEAHFRATLSRITTAAGRLRALPEGAGAPECSFTLAIELKDHADRPVGRIESEERRWMAAEPEPETVQQGQTTSPPPPVNQKPQSAQTHAIRRLEAGELRMEVWVEESAAKFEFPVPAGPEDHQPGTSQTSPQAASSSSSAAAAAAAKRAATMSYGAGTHKFDLENNQFGYDLEPPDVNRRPQGGAMTDYQRG